ncbi:LrgB family protein [Salinisphaera sp. Q1T1-3]|uniref:LrgB family protein n=1 Tax=Salinisphaera sp. Q1T1-3 TaxID=2321229 RepID=UPI000E7507E3|nr:LrgB family protein [Salinisphaera sp. Q1T1-3]RJS91032.1 LrgB family protein [Salinisphaera sp. Q1T1-3]
MNAITQIWVYLAEQPLLWLTLTVGIFWLAQQLYRLAGDFPLLNPVLVSVAVLVVLLLATGTPYHEYFDGAQFISFLLGPATVALAVPLASQAATLKRLWLPIAIALTVGSLTAVLSALAIGTALGLRGEMMLSMLPKSVTTPIAMGISDQIGGSPSLTAVFVILTGIVGAAIGIPLLRVLGLRDPVAKGFALGVGSHGIGTARAFEHSDRAGAFSGLAMGLNGALTAILVPIIVWLAGL